MSALVFFTSRLTGDPTVAVLAAGGGDMSPEALERVRASLGLDRPVLTQYGEFLTRAVRGDLGYSFWQQAPVTLLVLERLPASAALAAVAGTAAILLGLAGGILAGRHRGSAVSRLLMSGSALGMSLPVFWLGPMLILVFAVTLGWLPAFGAGTPSAMVLPAVTLAIPTAARIARLVRSSTIDVYASDFVLAAVAKGLTPTGVLWRHALRGIVAPVIPLAALEVGGMLGSAVIAEFIFAWPGIGRLVVDAVTRRDFPLVQGAALFIGAVFVTLNLLADILGRLTDPQLARTHAE